MNCIRNTHVIRSQSSQTKKLNFLTWPDLAFGFVNKRSGYEISDSKGLFYRKSIGGFSSHWNIQSIISDSTLEYWTLRCLPFRSDYFCIDWCVFGMNQLKALQLLWPLYFQIKKATSTCSISRVLVCCILEYHWLFVFKTIIWCRREIFILGVLGFLKTTRSFPKIPENVRSWDLKLAGYLTWR